MPVSSRPAVDQNLASQLALLDALHALERDLRRTDDGAAETLRKLHTRHRQSGRNLVQYLALRHHDVRGLQAGLARLGLSSLGRSEAHVARSVAQVRAVLETLVGLDPAPQAVPVGFAEGESLLEANTDALLGPAPAGRRNRIMVTLPSEAASDPELVAAMIREGMDCARINAAHDGPDAWQAMAANVRRAAAEAGRVCLVQIDIAGPKLRTGPLPAPLKLRPGDTIVLTADLSAGGAVPGEQTRIGCTLRAVFDHVTVGDPIWFDDGRIGGAIVAVRPGEADVEIRFAAPKGTKLKAEKGINLPDTDLCLAAITPDDSDALAFAAAQADLVALSFVQRPGDVEQLLEELSARGATGTGIILKIETKQAFARLPELLLTAMTTERVGVMIARGDLAVECGFERLAEVQEEILWLCEAAHVPVVWATQVLDQLARTGQPSRAEITDAAMSERAECVMLNKGPHILEAIAVLDDILRRMSGHQQKKVPLLRQLRAWA